MAVRPELFSGAADLSTGDGTTMKFEYRGDKLRINMEDDQGYMIADETVGLTEEEIMPFLKEKGHPALDMESLV